MQKKLLKYKDLPIYLQHKYKNSIIFQKQEKIKSKKINFDPIQLHNRKVQKQKTIEEKLEEFTINPTQQKYVSLVFDRISASSGGKSFGQPQISLILKKVQLKQTKSQIQRMIWQFDQNLNKRITKQQFINMYKRCIMDKNSAQSKNLFHLTQFLMYCRPDQYKITVEDTLELLFVRAKIQLQKTNLFPEQKQIIHKLQQQIQIIFQGQQKTPQGLEKQITFKQYLQRVNRRAIEKRRQQIAKKKNLLKYGVEVSQ